MIEAALVALGGRAMQKDIADYIEAHYPEVQSRSTWRNSVSGTLSTNPLFAAEPVVLESGKKARYNIWVLRKEGPPGAAMSTAAPAHGADAESSGSGARAVGPDADASLGDASEEMPSEASAMSTPAATPGPSVGNKPVCAFASGTAHPPSSHAYALAEIAAYPPAAAARPHGFGQGCCARGVLPSMLYVCHICVKLTGACFVHARVIERPVPRTRCHHWPCAATGSAPR